MVYGVRFNFGDKNPKLRNFCFEVRIQGFRIQSYGFGFEGSGWVPER